MAEKGRKRLSTINHQEVQEMHLSSERIEQNVAGFFQPSEYAIEDDAPSIIDQFQSGYSEKEVLGAQGENLQIQGQLDNFVQGILEANMTPSDSMFSMPVSEEAKFGHRRQRQELAEGEMAFHLDDWDLAVFKYGTDNGKEGLTPEDIAFLEYGRCYPKFIMMQNEKTKLSPRCLSPFQQAFLKYYRECPKNVIFVEEEIDGERIKLLSWWDRAFLDYGRAYPELVKISMKKIGNLEYYQLDQWEQAFLENGRLFTKEVNAVKDADSNRTYYEFSKWYEAVLNWGRIQVRAASLTRLPEEGCYVLSQFHSAILSAGKFFQPNLIALLPSGAVVLSKWAFAFFNGIEEHPKNEMLGEDGKTLSKWELAKLYVLRDRTNTTILTYYPFAVLVHLQIVVNADEQGQIFPAFCYNCHSVLVCMYLFDGSQGLFPFGQLQKRGNCNQLCPNRWGSGLLKLLKEKLSSEPLSLLVHCLHQQLKHHIIVRIIIIFLLKVQQACY